MCVLYYVYVYALDDDVILAFMHDIWININGPLLKKKKRYINGPQFLCFVVIM